MPPIQNPKSSHGEVGDKWLVVRVRRGHERLVCNFLTESGYEAFCPSYKARHYTTRNRSAKVEHPLFPLYVFCRSTPLARGRILHVPGVVGLAGSRLIDRLVDDAEIQILKQLQASHAFVNPRAVHSGDKVFINAGPLRGVEGVLLRENEEQGMTGMIVSVKLLARSISVEVDREWVSPIKT
jgi:transcription antitermination factor NusG